MFRAQIPVPIRLAVGPANLGQRRSGSGEAAVVCEGTIFYLLIKPDARSILRSGHLIAYVMTTTVLPISRRYGNDRSQYRIKPFCILNESHACKRNGVRTWRDRRDGFALRQMWLSLAGWYLCKVLPFPRSRKLSKCSCLHAISYQTNHVDTDTHTPTYTLKRSRVQMQKGT